MSLIWYSLAQQELPQVLLGEITLSSDDAKSEPDLNCSDTVLGMSDPGDGASPVVAIVLVGLTRKALFSWISAYAEEVFPLTQFSRVCSFEDWFELDLRSHKESIVGPVNPIWPSLVLGEMLGQVDAGAGVAATPLVRASACFSFTVARSTLLYPGNKSAEAKCIERLEVVERDLRFGHRQITVAFFKKVWSIIHCIQTVSLKTLNFPDAIIQVVTVIDSRAAGLLAANYALQSDSAESRIIGFDSIVNTFLSQRSSDEVWRDSGAIALAAASLLAGRGTGHIQLLAPTAKLVPETLPWFGLLAGVLGPRNWDKAWMQQAKGVERALRQFFRPDEPVTADLCWPEYEWLSQTYNSLEAISNIPKGSPRNLAIELLPGVNCQFRLAGPGANVSVKDERNIAETEHRQRTSVISESNIAQAVNLIEQARRLLQPQETAEPVHGNLFENCASATQVRRPRRKSGGKQDKTSST
ncbi:MAG: hypothetical protein EPN21_14235 [Methylococcaceae bacterium]|nr:MAG: hypothetical protein EPN21_14235 [Methylococcaceae bacterium]